MLLMSTTDTIFLAGDLVSVDGYDGVAWRVSGPQLVWEPDMTVCEDEDGNEWEEPTDDGEWVPGDRIVCVMVGDDRDFDFDPEDLTPLPDDQDVCSCGQIGCGW